MGQCVSSANYREERTRKSIERERERGRAQDRERERLQVQRANDLHRGGAVMGVVQREPLEKQHEKET